MNKLCPISDQRQDTQLARINALFLLLFSLIFAFTQIGWVLVFVCIDLIIRGFFNSRYSLIAMMGKQLVKWSGLKPKWVNAGPKIFAAQVGSFFAVFSLLFLTFGSYSISIALVSMLAFFAFLEAFFGYCVACTLYPLIRKTDSP